MAQYNTLRLPLLDNCFRECIPNCQNCSLPPIRIHLVTLPRGIRSGTSFLRLTAYDTKWRVLYDTKYSIKAIKRFQKRLPFILKVSFQQFAVPHLAVVQKNTLVGGKEQRLSFSSNLSSKPHCKKDFSRRVVGKRFCRTLGRYWQTAVTNLVLKPSQILRTLKRDLVVNFQYLYLYRTKGFKLCSSCYFRYFCHLFCFFFQIMMQIFPSFSSE